LKSSIEKIMLDIVYNIEDFKHKKIVITDKFITSNNLSDLSIDETLIFIDTEEIKEEKIDKSNEE